MATSNDFRSRVTDIATCPMCLELYDKPKCLPGLHTFCLKCVHGHCRDKLPGDEVPCPLCREKFKIPLKGLDELKNNFFVQSLVDARKTSIDVIQAAGVACEVCGEESGHNVSSIPESTVYCVDCRQKMCERCSVPHRRWKGGPHKVIPLGREFDSGLVEVGGSYCDKHGDELVKLFCVNCQENICLMCSAIEHDQHKRQEISKVADEFVSKIDTSMKQLGSRIGDVRKSINVFGESCDSFMKESKNIETAVKQKGEEVKLLVDRHVNSLLEELESIKHATCKEAESCKERLELDLLGMESFNTYWLELKSKGKPSDITRVGNELNTRASFLLQTDIAVDCVMPQIEFVSKNMDKLEIGFIERTYNRRSEQPAKWPKTDVKCDDVEEWLSNLNGQRTTESCSSRSIEVYGDRESFPINCCGPKSESKEMERPTTFAIFAQMREDGAAGGVIETSADFDYVKCFRGGNRQQLSNPFRVTNDTVGLKFKSVDSRLQDEEMYEKLNSILDTLSHMTYQHSVCQVLALPINTEERLRGCADMIFEKAINDPNAVIAFANLVKCMVLFTVPSQSDPELSVTFRYVFLNKCQQEFEKVTTRKHDVAESKILDEGWRWPECHHDSLLTKAKSRSTGVVRLIGELFNLRMLTEGIVHECLRQLLSPPSYNEDSLEFACELLTTVGQKLDREKATLQPNIEEYFKQFKTLFADSKTSDHLRYILYHLIDLRENGWVQ